MSTELIFDHCEGIGSKLAKARTYAVSDTYNDGDFTDIVVSPLVNSLTCKDVPALQAADFLFGSMEKTTRTSVRRTLSHHSTSAHFVSQRRAMASRNQVRRLSRPGPSQPRTKEGLHPKRAGLDQALYRNCWRARHTRRSHHRWRGGRGPRGRTNFSELQAELAAGRQGRLVYYAFDLCGGMATFASCRNFERKQLLLELLGENDVELPVLYSEHLTGDGQVMFEHAAKLNWEAIVSKRADAPYRSERTEAWLKIKTVQREKFPVIRIREGPHGRCRSLSRQA